MADIFEPEYTVVEAATQSEVGCHPNTVAKALTSGALQFRWKGSGRLIRRSHLLAWAATRQRGSGAPPVSLETTAS